MGWRAQLPGHEDGPSLLKPLDAAGVDYTTLAAEEGCCGFPLFLMGTDEFEDHAKKTPKRSKPREPGSLSPPAQAVTRPSRDLSKFADLGLEVLSLRPVP